MEMEKGHTSIRRGVSWSPGSIEETSPGNPKHSWDGMQCIMGDNRIQQRTDEPENKSDEECQSVREGAKGGPCQESDHRCSAHSPFKLQLQRCAAFQPAQAKGQRLYTRKLWRGVSG
ncbi:hypothetical protein OYC64_013367 [Pagothenia borchgrevinki]|uniref:Uncharacterized protein n=1 Tax=Pagothenia borchgrevinki TaxID=8213 RepID=A0ABD2FTT6_PAGBO